MTRQINSVLILSTGRTGTKFLATVLCEILPEAAVYHEGGERSRLINIFTNAYLAGMIPKTYPPKIWNVTLKPGLHAAMGSATHYIDVNNHLYAFSTLYKELYPNLTIIHIIRDPRTYIQSHINWSRSRVKSFIANHLTPFWQPTGYLVGSMGYKDWYKWTWMERFAWVWMFKNDLIAGFQKRKIPYLVVRFEDLFHSDQPGITLKQIIEFMGISVEGDLNHYFEKSINVSNKRSIPDWENWSVDICVQIDSICGELMEKYGYGGEPEWQKKISIKPS